MALKALLLILAPLATALVPPCLPEFGPQFCPGSPEADLSLRSWNRKLSPRVYPNLTHGSLLKNEVFPLLVNSEPSQSLGSAAKIAMIISQNKTDLKAGVELYTLPRWKPNRYCRSKYGVIAKDWITLAVAQFMNNELKRPNGSSLPCSFKYVENETPQKSIVLRVMPPSAPFKAGNTIVLGAHMDSINIKAPKNQSAEKMVAPGADDNASGTVVLLFVMKLLGRLFLEKPVTNEVQFHWYGAEEIGLKGSESVFATLRNQSFAVKAMLNLDMVGYAGGHEPGAPKIALQEGFADKDLTAFVAKLVETVSTLFLRESSGDPILTPAQYTDAEPGFTSCAYACSDHASANQSGFPAAMMGESSYLKGKGSAPNGNPYIHSENDTIETLDFDYMLEFAKVAAAFVVELAYTNFTELEAGGR